MFPFTGKKCLRTMTHARLSGSMQEFAEYMPNFNSYQKLAPTIAGLFWFYFILKHFSYCICNYLKICRNLNSALPQLSRTQNTPVSYVLCILLKINSLLKFPHNILQGKIQIFKLTIPRLLNSCHQMYSQTSYFHPQTQWC